MTDDSEPSPEFETLLHFLQESRGFDFTGYKRPSLRRRVDRRMQEVSIASYAEYQDYLQVHQEEYVELFNTIFINVTGFLRDPETWTHFRAEVLPDVVANPKAPGAIRVWSAGCASGEEAYSVAISLAEVMGPEEFRERVKIYATDVDEDALNSARQASYAEADIAALPDELRDKYFEPANGRYVFRADLRRSIIFGRNDLVQDAPISRVDLLLCRNTLMYFNAEAQAKILSRFNFALTDGGVLFLGKAEMLLSHGALFAPINLKHRLFRKAPQERGGPRNGALTNGVTLPDYVDASPLRSEALAANPTATIVVTATSQVALINKRAEAMFNLTVRDVGRAFRDLEVSYRPIELRAYVEQAMLDRRPILVPDVEWQRSAGESVHLDVQVTPLFDSEGAELGCALFFNDVSRYHKLQSDLEYTNRQLETAYEELQSTVEELETTNEELQSTVEELETTNEELQSTNEELETMNEELQSTNDELQTINDELRDRTQELDEANGFMESILRSINAAVVVVDRDLRVRVWNRRADDLWGVRTAEAVGQNLLNLDIGLSTDELKPVLRRAIQEAETQDELRLDAINRRGRSITVRVVASPLTLQDGAASGAILVIDEQD
jgi:two-component system CheB/CheR fusion protein